MEASTMKKILVLNMLLAVAIHADADTPPSIDSPLSSNPLPRFPPPEEVDPAAPPPMSCKEQCMLKCAEKRGLRRMFCIGRCLAFCKITSPSDHAGFQCTRDCVINSLHHQPDIKSTSIEGLVNTCYNNCSKHV